MRYKFDVGEKVIVKGTDESGIVEDRRFALFSLSQGKFTPGRYYVVALTDDFFGRDLSYTRIEVCEESIQRRGFDNGGGENDKNGPNPPAVWNPEDRYTAYYWESVRKNKKILEELAV
jgi:hypothetical protein